MTNYSCTVPYLTYLTEESNGSGHCLLLFPLKVWDLPSNPAFAEARSKQSPNAVWQFLSQAYHRMSTSRWSVSTSWSTGVLTRSPALHRRNETGCPSRTGRRPARVLPRGSCSGRKAARRWVSSLGKTRGGLTRSWTLSLVRRGSTPSVVDGCPASRWW